MTINIPDYIPRLSKGAGDGVNKLCAMQFISYINGDSKITDYPECSARPLASLVQACNDQLADKDGFLSPENSLTVLDLGWQTMGTAGASDSMIHAWMAEVLANPEWGVVRFAKGEGITAISNIAEMHRKVVRGEMKSAESAAESAALVDFTRRAITCWRELQGIDQNADIFVADVDSALKRIGIR
jgi:hypothetical protein